MKLLVVNDRSLFCFGYLESNDGSLFRDFLNNKAGLTTALKAGVNNYIVKSFTPQVLKQKLVAVLGIEN